MRLVIGLCRYCLQDKEMCMHRAVIQNQTTQIRDIPGTLCHHCPVYYKQIPVGTRVRVELKEIECEPSTSYYDPGIPPGAEWVSAGFADGEVVDYSRVKKGFFIIKLDQPVTLVLPPPEGSWQDAKPVEVEFRMKRARDMEILEDKP